MEIKQKIEMSVATKRRFIIRRARSNEEIFCRECGGATLTAEQCAAFFGTNQRVIFQIIETGATHFAETETGAVMICLSSLAAVLEANDGRKLLETGEFTDTNLENFNGEK